MTITVASLQARADGGQFTLVQTANTPLTGGGNMPFQPAHPQQQSVPHKSSSRTAIGWTAVYRTQRLQGEVLIVDTVVASSFLQYVLDRVNVIFDSIDLNVGLVGYPQNTHQGPTGQPQFLPSGGPLGVPD